MTDEEIQKRTRALCQSLGLHRAVPCEECLEIGVFMASAVMVESEAQASKLGAVTQQLAIVKKQNADNLKMRNEYMKERDVANHKITALLEVVDAARAHIGHNISRPQVFLPNDVMRHRLAKALKALVEKQKCEPVKPTPEGHCLTCKQPVGSNGWLLCDPCAKEAGVIGRETGPV